MDSRLRRLEKEFHILKSHVGNNDARIRNDITGTVHELNVLRSDINFLTVASSAKNEEMAVLLKQESQVLDDHWITDSAYDRRVRYEMDAMRFDIKQLRKSVYNLSVTVSEMQDEIHENLNLILNNTALLDAMLDEMHVTETVIQLEGEGLITALDDIANVGEWISISGKAGKGVSVMWKIGCAVAGGIAGILAAETGPGAVAVAGGTYAACAAGADILHDAADTVDDIGSAIASTARKAENMVKSSAVQNALSIMRSGLTTLDALAADVADNTASAAEKETQKDAIIGMYVKEVADAVHHLQEIDNDVELTGRSAVKCFYCLTPLVKASVSRKTIEKMQQDSDFSLADTSDHVLAHAFLIFYNNIDDTHRRRITMSVGDFESGGNFSGKAKFADQLYRSAAKGDSLFGFEDVVQFHDGTSWTIPGGVQIDGSPLSIHQPNTSEAVIAGHFLFYNDINYIKELMLIYRDFEDTAYNLFTHNCQVVSHEIINFLDHNTKPHFWTSTLSARMLRAKFSRLHDHPAVINSVPVTQYHARGKSRNNHLPDHTVGFAANTRHLATPGFGTTNVQENVEALHDHVATDWETYLDGIINA
jgi:hypothetical protein